MAKYLLGTDNGGTVSKAGLFTLDGKEIVVASRQTDLLTPKPNYVERDMTEMWTATAAMHLARSAKCLTCVDT